MQIKEKGELGWLVEWETVVWWVGGKRPHKTVDHTPRSGNCCLATGHGGAPLEW